MTKPAPANAERRLLSYALAAAYLGVSERQVKILAATGEIPKTPIGSRVLLDRVDLDEFIARAKRDAAS